mgnify:CR=1 FL=1
MVDSILTSLLKKISKHSQYQTISDIALPYLSDELNLCIGNKFEKERLDFFKKYIDFENKSFVDIGGNTGYFSFELMKHYATKGHYIEGNEYHFLFVKRLIDLLNLTRLKITNDYLNFDNIDYFISTDVCLLLNVLHHVGDDFLAKLTSIEESKEFIAITLSKLARSATILVFQLGFNWKGNPSLPLFQNGTKEELINFVEDATSSDWYINQIGIPEVLNGKVHYALLDEKNCYRQDELGEFLNRPLFILKSKFK